MDDELLQIKASHQRIMELIEIFERSGIVYPWWQDDTLEQKSAKLLAWLQDDICRMQSVETSNKSSGDRS